MKLIDFEGSSSIMNVDKGAANAADAYEQVFQQCFEEHWTSVHRLLIGMLGDPEEAQDLAFEAFLRLYERRLTFEAGSQTRAWLSRVAINLALHSIRSFRRREGYELAAGKMILEQSLGEHPEEGLQREEERRTARAVLAAMNPRQARLLLLRYSDLPYKEIALTLGLSPTSIGPLLLRAEREFEKRYRQMAQEEA